MATTTNTSKASSEVKMTPDQFVLRAITSLRNEEGGVNKNGKAFKGSKGIHSTFSGFNDAFRLYFDDDDIDPIEHQKDMVERGLIETRYAFKGVMIFLPGDAPAEWESRSERASDTLSKMGVAPKGSNPSYQQSRKASPVVSRRSR